MQVIENVSRIEIIRDETSHEPFFGIQNTHLIGIWPPNELALLISDPRFMQAIQAKAKLSQSVMTLQWYGLPIRVANALIDAAIDGPPLGIRFYQHLFFLLQL
jgi:hypothetical protein